MTVIKSALYSEKIPVANVSSLLEFTSFDTFESQLTKFRSIDPEKAFPTSEMASLKQNVSQTLSQYDESALPDDAVELKDRISSISPLTLSAILFGSFYAIDGFSVNDFDFSLESLVRLNIAITAYYTLLQGGCEVLRVALNTIRNLSDLNTDDLDIGEALDSFFASVAGTIESIAESIQKSVIDIANDIIEGATNAVNAVLDAVNSLTNLQLKDITEAIENIGTTIVEFVENQISLLVSGVGSLADDFVRITQQCAGHTKKTMDAKLENLENNVEKIPDLFVTVSPSRALKIQKRLNDRIKRSKQQLSNTNVQYMRAQTAAISKKYSENNKNADTFERENAIKNTIAKMNETNDEVAEKTVDETSKQIEESYPKYQDITTKSNQTVADSNIGGRKTVDKQETVKKAKQFSEKYSVYDKSFFGGPYASTIAERINQMHYTVRDRFANAFRDLTTNQDLIDFGYTFTITSSFRSLEKQRSLYDRLKPQGKAVAFPGNSWHNYGLAMDVGAFFKGDYIRTSPVYINIIRPIFEQYNIHNPLSNDRIHFQPTEVPTSARSIRHELVTSRNTINDDRIETLFA